MSVRIRVLLANMPPMLAGVVEQVLDQADLEVVDIVNDNFEVLLATGRTQADVVVLGIDEDALPGPASYLLEEQMAVVAFNNGVPLYVELPAAVELTITQTDPGVQGDRSTGGTKPATLETGAQIHVPLFITTGEKVKVDTRTGDYLGRA